MLPEDGVLPPHCATGSARKGFHWQCCMGSSGDLTTVKMKSVKVKSEGVCISHKLFVNEHLPVSIFRYILLLISMDFVDKVILSK